MGRLYVLRLQRIAPICVKHVFGATVFALCESAVASLLVSDGHDAVALLVEDDSRDAEKEILHIRNLLQEESAQRIVHLEEVDILVVAWQFGFDVVVLESKTVAGEHVEKFVLCHHAALSDAFDELVG